MDCRYVWDFNRTRSQMISGLVIVGPTGRRPASGSYNLLAAFVRENGQSDPLTGVLSSHYVGSSIFFLPPPAPPGTPLRKCVARGLQGYQSGTSHFLLKLERSTLILPEEPQGFIRFDHIVDIGVVNNSIQPTNPQPGLPAGPVYGSPNVPNLQSLLLRVVARYYLQNAPFKDYRSGANNSYNAFRWGHRAALTEK